MLCVPLLTAITVFAVYAFFAAGGSWKFRHGMRSFGPLGDAFLAGHLYLQTAPAAQLLADPDPYNPQRRNALMAQGVPIMLDASL